MDINWQIVAASAGFAGMRALMFEYRDWKSRRTEIPLDWNPRTQTYEPDLKLRRWERFGKIAAWGAAGAMCFLGYNAVANGWFN
ncbi:hypothetical protein K7W03_14465 [Sphingobium sp. PNB]|uniref:hypothetical protein n=1 Tax=Sphingobium sp. PNB TaxID=863934 RepID=UPI001CA40947|nr:hypothetical protein [Sphingobium sp. PNB]MCB4860795.1 hypothetical protein [Sphingobium sp. PNB]